MTPHGLIKKLREEKGLSQEEVAKVIGVSRPTYVAIEQDKRDLTLFEASELSKILQVSLEDIQAGKISMPKVIFEKGKKTKVPRKIGDEVWERISVPQERVDKFKKVLLYVLSKVGGKPNVGQTVLYKLPYFIDFDYYEKF